MRQKLTSFLQKSILTAAIFPFMTTVANAQGSVYGITPPKTGIIRVDTIADSSATASLMPFVVIALISGMLFIASGQLLKLKLNQTEA